MQLVVTGSEPVVLFQHSDGTAYGSLPLLPEVDVRARAFRALRALGFGERETRGALAQCATRVGSDAESGADAELDSLLRRTLELLTAGSWAKAS